MSLHSDLIAGIGTPLLLEAHGETLLVQVKGEDSPRELTALVNRERTVRKYSDQGTKLVSQRRVTITSDEASRFGGLVELLMNAVVTYGETDYAVAERPSELNGTIAALLERPATETRTEGHYRNR